MPNITLPVPYTYETVTRNVALSVIEKLVSFTRMPREIPVRFPGSIPTMYQNGSTLSEEEKNIFTQQEKLLITVDEEYEENSHLNTASLYEEVPYVFKDPILGVGLKTVYSNTTMRITVTYRGTGRAAVEQWRNSVRIAMSNNRGHVLCELMYHYPVPTAFTELIGHIHQLRENQGGYGDDVDTYIRTNAIGPITTLSNQAGNGELYVFKEKQVGVQLMFDFEFPPETEKTEGGSAWLISFTVKLDYHKPISACLSYPLVVHNQFIAERYFVKERPYGIPIDNVRYTKTRANILSSESSPDTYTDPAMGRRFPVYDDWVPTTDYNYILTAVQWLVGITLSDKRTLLDLTDLGDQVFAKGIVEYLIEEAPYLTKYRESALFFSVYNKDSIVNQEKIMIDENLQVVGTEDLDIRGHYHVKLGVMFNLALLPPRAIESLKRHWLAFLVITQTLLGSVEVYKTIMTIPSCYRLITRWGGLSGGLYDGWLNDFYDWVKQQGIQCTMPDSLFNYLYDKILDRYKLDDNSTYNRKLTGYLTIIAMK